MKRCSGKSVGAIIKRGEKVLLIDRRNFPFGWAGPAGHLEEGETPEEAIRRETVEETKLSLRNLELLLHQDGVPNTCSYGTRRHDWWVFQCKAKGLVVIDEKEAKSFGWFAPEEIRKLELEPVWKKWFKLLKII